MGATSEAAWARASRARERAGALCSASHTAQRRAEQVADRVVQTLSRAGTRAFGDRGDLFLLELARLRPTVGLARNDLRRWLEAIGLPNEVIGEVTLACSEACANAVEHPRQVSRQRIALKAERRDGELEIRVRDFGSWREHPPSDQRGRGLDLISELMDSVDLRRRPDGSEIVMRRFLCGSSAPLPSPAWKTGQAAAPTVGDVSRS